VYYSFNFVTPPRGEAVPGAHALSFHPSEKPSLSQHLGMGSDTVFGGPNTVSE